MGAARDILDTKFLRTLIPMADMDPSGFNRLAGNYRIEHYQPGDTIFKRGDHQNQTCYLISGELILQFMSGLEKKLVANSDKARHALIPEQPRQATATAQTPLSILSIDSDLLDELMSVNNRSGYEVTEIQGENNCDWMTKFLQSKVFIRLPAQNIQALMMRLEEVSVSAGQVIIRQGDDDGNYYIVKSGRCKVTRRYTPHENEIELAILTPGSGFGEEAIITNNRRGASITMLSDGCLMRLSREDFTSLLVDPLIHEAKYEDLVGNNVSVFLDVRSYDDYIKDGITKSQNISLSEMRSKVHVLDHKNRYVICSNTGIRAAAASFLLGQHGFDTVVLSQGLAGLPEDVDRGNSNGIDADSFPLVDNVVSFTAAKSPVIQSIKAPSQPAPSLQITAEMAMNEPRVNALFSKAKQRLQLEAQRASDAEAARKEAEKQIARLHAEAELAKAQVRDEQRKVDIAARQSVEKARMEALKESAKLRKVELGCKEAEMEEAIHQAEEEADRAREAINAKYQAEKETESVKHEMQMSIAHANEELARAQDEALAVRLSAEQEIKKVRQQLEQERQLIAQRARTLAEAARTEVAEQTDRISTEKQAIVDQAVLVAEQQAKRAEELDAVRNDAEQEIKRLKLEAEVARLQIQEQLSADISRSEIEHQVAHTRAIELANKQSEIVEMTGAAEEASQRAQLAEQGHSDAQREIECLRAKLDVVGEQSQLDTANVDNTSNRESQDTGENVLFDMQAEIEAAGLRAEEAAKKQAEVIEVASKAKENAQRAELAERERYQAEAEIKRLKTEAEQQRIKAKQAIEDSIKAAKRTMDEKLIGLLAREKTRRELEMEQNKSHKINQMRSKPASKENEVSAISSNPTQLANTQSAKYTPLKKPAGNKVQSEWVSDLAMWETTLGIREDATIEHMVSPDAPSATQSLNKPEQNVLQNLEEKEQAANDADHDSDQRAIFTGRDINPNINSQKVVSVVHNAKRIAFRRLLIAFLGCGVLAFAGYYWMLSEVQQISLNDNILGSFLSEASIQKLTGKVKQKAKISISSAQKSKQKAPSAETNDTLDSIKLKVRAQRKRTEAVKKKQLERAQFNALSAEINRSIQKQQKKTPVIAEPDTVGATMATESQRTISTQAPLVAIEKEPMVPANTQAKEIDIQIEVVDPLVPTRGRLIDPVEPQINDTRVGQQRIDIAPFDDEGVIETEQEITQAPSVSAATAASAQQPQEDPNVGGVNNPK